MKGGLLLTEQYTVMGIKYNKSLGKRLADFSTKYYNPPLNTASRGQCVWYTQGRADEKTGVYIGARGNGRDVYESCKKDGFQVSKYPKTNSIACYNGGTYGHVRYVEYVIADNVYYTESNENSDNILNATDGILKKMSLTNWMNQPNLQGHVVVKKEKLINFKVTTANKKIGLYKSSNTKKKSRVKLVKADTVKAVAGSGKIKNGRDIVKVLYDNRYYWAIRTTKAKIKQLKRVK